MRGSFPDPGEWPDLHRALELSLSSFCLINLPLEISGRLSWWWKMTNDMKIQPQVFLADVQAWNCIDLVTSSHFLSPRLLYFWPLPQRTSFQMIYVLLCSLRPNGKIVEKTCEESQPILYLAVMQHSRKTLHQQDHEQSRKPEPPVANQTCHEREPRIVPYLWCMFAVKIRILKNKSSFVQKK